MNTKKAFFFDIDGTLIYESSKGAVIPKTAIDSINKLHKLGYKVFLATGRAESFIFDFLYKLPLDGIVSANGAVVRIGEKIIFEEILPKKTILDVINFCKENNCVYSFEGDIAYVENKNAPEIVEFLKGISFNEDKIFNTNDINEIKAYGGIIIGDNIDLDKFQEEIGDEYQLAPHQKYGYIDFYQKNNSKADGIKKVIKSLNLEDYKTFAFGDGNNDIEMMKFVDVAVVMGNGSDKLKQYANYITTSQKEDGIYNALKHYNII